jgi:hypothetical protein
VLPAATERIWNFLKEQRTLAGFVLVGGSALALRIRHRLSEDLDFAFPELKLPQTRLDALLRQAAEAGHDFQRDDDEAALLDFTQGGGDLHDYQQDFLVNGSVKVSFFAPEAGLARVLQEPAEQTPRVATLPELFKSKCLVSAVRSKTRDWLDLYLLLREHGFSMRDYQTAFREAGVEHQCDIGLSRLCSGVPQLNDEGYAHLLPEPPTLDQMRTFFIAQRDALEVETATEAARTRQPPTAPT